jgi:hypothetical protein
VKKKKKLIDFEQSGGSDFKFKMKASATLLACAILFIAVMWPIHARPQQEEQPKEPETEGDAPQEEDGPAQPGEPLDYEYEGPSSLSAHYVTILTSQFSLFSCALVRLIFGWT